MPRTLVWVFSLLLIATNLGLVSAAEQLVWPLPPQEPRIAFVQSINSSQDIGAEKRSFLQKLVFGQQGPQVFLVKPYGVTTDSRGYIYVTDTGRPRVAVFDPSGKKAWYMGDQGRGQLTLPIGITSGPDDSIYVCDAGQKQVVVYGPDGVVNNTIGNPTILQNPTGVALDWERQYLYVADTKDHSVLVFALDSGVVLKKLGGPGVGPGQFNGPTNLFVDAQGHLYVTDTLNFRIQVFDPQGNYLFEFGQAGDTAGSFARPKGVGVDSFGHIYVIDAAFNNFQIFNDQKRLLLFVGTGGSAPGQFRLPAGIHIGAANQIYIVDQLNRRIQVFRFLAGE